jgi:hypothetical protein
MMIGMICIVFDGRQQIIKMLEKKYWNVVFRFPTLRVRDEITFGIAVKFSTLCPRLH